MVGPGDWSQVPVSTTGPATPPRGRVAPHSGLQFPTASTQVLACGPHYTSLRSGRRELNPVYMHPMHVYYHHTPARLRRYSLSGRRELNSVYTHPKRAYYRHTPARWAVQDSDL